MAVPTWIDLQFGARGELRPILVEHRIAYKIFDGQAFHPRLVLAIGGAEKRHFYRTLELDAHVPGNGIFLRPFQLATLLIDCELHNQSTLGICEQAAPMGHQTRHTLHCAVTPNSPPQRISQFALDMYWQLLFPFASVVLLFADDLGGLEPVIELLVCWTRRARLKPLLSPPRVIVVFHWRHRSKIETFEVRLRARLTGRDPTASTSTSGISAPIRLDHEHAFESVYLVPTWKLSSEFLVQVEESFGVRESAGFAFSGEHTKTLLETAVNQFGQSCGQQIDFHDAVRLPNPIPDHLAEGISCFIRATNDSDLDQVTIIASALDLDAHPPGAHFHLRPPTAGLRMLELGGTSQDKWEMLNFLKELRSITGLGISLREQFDLVVGSGIGLFFVQTAFLEDWALSDCKYHAKNLHDPKIIDSKNLFVSFGKRLTWKMAKTSGMNGLFVVFVLDSHRASQTIERDVGVRGFLRRQHHDVVVRYMGAHCDSPPPKLAASRMIASLFYIELVFTPHFYSTPERVQARLLCRLPPSATLISLVTDLHARGTRVIFWGTELEPNVESLVTSSSLSRCRRGEAFVKRLDIEVWSPDSELHVVIDDDLMGKHNVSHCPYVLRELSHDQGLDCVFGRSDHCGIDTTKDVGTTITEEIDELSEELGRFASWDGSWNFF
ncbi:patatin-like serine hydrolase [Fusarium phyllophilum]|uniref:Patatin-like serine hydrolase n=1 Tax=Fusarium phyllophilum TaxID=47803 RepID=A0A8H5KGB7_9HYPO|nr:patatin-like serine hydrolase [Fusarium phyllophilum]